MRGSARLSPTVLFALALALGHRSETYADPAFARHLLGGILWAAGRA